MSDAVNPVAVPSPAASPIPPIPVLRAGQRFTFKQLVGSSDAALIAQTALAHRNHYSQMVVLCASALDAQRLLEEIPGLLPNCVFVYCPIGRSCPTIISHPIKTSSQNAWRLSMKCKTGVAT